MTPAETIDEHGSTVQGMFDRIAPGYDRANHWMSLWTDNRWRRRAAQALALEGIDTPRVLDLCAGTMDGSVAILQRFPSARIVAGDFSAKMLEAGRAKLHGAAATQIEPRTMDAHAGQRAHRARHDHDGIGRAAARGERGREVRAVPAAHYAGRAEALGHRRRQLVLPHLRRRVGGHDVDAELGARRDPGQGARLQREQQIDRTPRVQRAAGAGDADHDVHAPASLLRADTMKARPRVSGWACTSQKPWVRKRAV